MNRILIILILLVPVLSFGQAPKFVNDEGKTVVVPIHDVAVILDNGNGKTTIQSSEERNRYLISESYSDVVSAYGGNIIEVTDFNSGVVFAVNRDIIQRVDSISGNKVAMVTTIPVVRRYILSENFDDLKSEIDNSYRGYGKIEAEVSDTTTLSRLNVFLPVDVSSNTVLVNLPATLPNPGDSFTVMDSRGNSGIYNIRINFTGASHLLHGQSEDYIINVDNTTIRFMYINSTIGWAILR